MSSGVVVFVAAVPLTGGKRVDRRPPSPPDADPIFGAIPERNQT